MSLGKTKVYNKETIENIQKAVENKLKNVNLLVDHLRNINTYYYENESIVGTTLAAAAAVLACLDPRIFLDENNGAETYVYIKAAKRYYIDIENAVRQVNKVFETLLSSLGAFKLKWTLDDQEVKELLSLEDRVNLAARVISSVFDSSIARSEQRLQLRDKYVKDGAQVTPKRMLHDAGVKDMHLNPYLRNHPVLADTSIGYGHPKLFFKLTK